MRVFEAKEMLKKEGNSLVYITSDGEIIKQFRKAWERNEKLGLTKVMEDITKNGEATPIALIEPEEANG